MVSNMPWECNMTVRTCRQRLQAFKPQGSSRWATCLFEPRLAHRLTTDEYFPGKSLPRRPSYTRLPLAHGKGRVRLSRFWREPQYREHYGKTVMEVCAWEAHHFLRFGLSNEPTPRLIPSFPGILQDGYLLRFIFLREGCESL